MWFIFACSATLLFGLGDMLIKRGNKIHGSDFFLRFGAAEFVLTFAEIIAFSMLISWEKGSPAAPFAVVWENSYLLVPLLIYQVIQIVSYLGADYMEMSVYAPIADSSGAMAVILFLLYAVYNGGLGPLAGYITPASIGGTLLTTVGIIGIAILQRKGVSEKKYKKGMAALLFPLMFCFADAVSTVIDSFAVYDEGSAEISVFSYVLLSALCMFTAGCVSIIILTVKKKQFFNPLKRENLSYMGAAVATDLGFLMYLYAIEDNPILSIPVCATCGITALMFSHIFLKEKLTKWQYVSIAIVTIGVLAIASAGL